jgi:cell division protein FtsQ
MPKETKKPAPINRWKWVLTGGVLFLVTVSTAVAAIKVRQFALTDPQFKLSSERKGAIEIYGLTYASGAKIARLFATDFEHSVFLVPLAERRRRLLAVDWVEDATVSRIWPDRLVVRVRERKPLAFVFFRSGVLLIDSRGVLLEPPPQAQFTFPVLSGLRDTETESQRRQRVRCLLRVQEELGEAAKDLSEVNATDVGNVRIVIQVEHTAVELILGDNDFGGRFRNFVKHFPDIQRATPNARTFDLRLDDRIMAED